MRVMLVALAIFAGMSIAVDHADEERFNEHVRVVEEHVERILA